MAVDQASSKEKKAHIDRMKAMCFLMISDQNRYSFLLKKMRYRENVVMDEYPVKTPSQLDPLIRIEGKIRGNQKPSTYKNRGGRGRLQHREHIEHTSTQHIGGIKDNTTLVPGKDGKTLNVTCYKCCKLGHLTYNLLESGRTGTFYLYFIQKFAQKQIQ